MKSKKVLALISVFVVATALILPYLIPQSSADKDNMPLVFASGKKLEECKHLHMYDPRFGFALPEPPVEDTWWHALYPPSEQCHQYNLTNLIDNSTGGPTDNGMADVGERIMLRDMGTDRWNWYNVEWVTVTLKVEHKETIKYLEFNGTRAQWISIWSYYANALNTHYHEVKPTFSQQWTIIPGWLDYDVNGKISLGDLLVFQNMATGEIFEGHVDEIATDLIVSLIERHGITGYGTRFGIVPNATNFAGPISTTFPIDIWVYDAPDTKAWALNLTFNPAVLELTGPPIQGSWLYSAGAATQFLNTSWLVANVSGQISVGCTQLYPFSAVSGSGWLCSLNFHVKGNGQSKLDLKYTSLMDMNDVKTYYPNNDGFFTNVLPTHDVAITNVIVNDTEVNVTDPVLITVTVVNQGTETQHVVVKAYADYIDVYDAKRDVALTDEIVISHNDCITLLPAQVLPVQFVWTAGPRGEAYTISAEVIKDDFKDDDINDNLFIGPTVDAKWAHDLRVTAINVLTPEVFRGQLADIKVTVKNQGQNDESFNVTVYADNTPVVSLGVNETVVSQTSTDVTLSWNTIDALEGTYTISAKAWPVPGETETDDNELSDGTVEVNVADISLFSFAVLTPKVIHARSITGYAPSACINSSRVIITFTLENLGSEVAGSVTVRLWANNTKAPAPGNPGNNRYYTSPTGWLPVLPPNSTDYGCGAIEAGERITYYFAWETRGIAPGVPQLKPGLYNMSIEVLPITGETNLINNYYRLRPYPQVFVVSIYDITQDFKVDSGDVLASVGAFGGVAPFIPPGDF